MKYILFLFLIVGFFPNLFAQAEYDSLTISQWQNIFKESESSEILEGIFNCETQFESNIGGQVKRKSSARVVLKKIKNKIYIYANHEVNNSHWDSYVKLTYFKGHYIVNNGNNNYSYIVEDVDNDHLTETFFKTSEISFSNLDIKIDYGFIAKIDYGNEIKNAKLSTSGYKVNAPKFDPIISLSTLVSQGSGFFINNFGYVITNKHVVEKGEYFKIVYNDIIYKAELITSGSLDVCVLKITESIPNISYLSLGNSDNIQLGQKLYVFGYPYESTLGSSIKVTDGILSSKLGFQDNSNYFQMSAPVNPGNSGGPIFNEKGDLIGVATSKLIKGENISFGLKINKVKTFLDENGIKYFNNSQNKTSNFFETGEKSCVIIKCYKI
ncbi:MAG: serine protease [Lewinellaceae bacterium]|nr:serine protease [Lewinellaceae bacterium]